MSEMDKKVWKNIIQEKIRNWDKGRLFSVGVDSIYIFICVMAFSSIVDLARSGAINAIPLLGIILGDIGKDLIANIIQKWKDESDSAAKLKKMLEGSKKEKVIKGLDMMENELDLISLCSRSLQEKEKPWFEGEIRKELIQLGLWEKNKQHLFENGTLIENATIVDSRIITMGSGSQYNEKPIVIGGIEGPKKKD